MAQIMDEEILQSPLADAPILPRAAVDRPRPPPKLRGRKRLLQNLQRISSFPSLVKMGRTSSAYNNGERGTMSCVSLASATPSTPSGHRYDNSYSSQSSAGYSTAPSSVLPTPGKDFFSSPVPGITIEDGSDAVRLIGLNLKSKAITAPTSVPVPADLRPSSKGLPLGVTPAIAESAYDYFSQPHLDHQTSIQWSRSRQSPWVRLPEEIKIRILGYLTHRELARCAKVSQSWHKTCFDGQLWTSIDATDYYRRLTPQSLQKLLTGAGPFLKDIQLRGCSQLRKIPGDEGISDMCRNLENISLEGCLLNEKPLYFLLARNKSLVHVNLSGLCAATNSACRTIAKNCPQLEYLNISWCHNINNRGVAAVVDGCSKLKDLRVSDIKGLNDKSFMNRLFEKNTLERLVLHHCSEVGDDGLKVLMEGIDNEVDPLTGRAHVPPRKLRHLDLSKNPTLTDKSLQSMVGNVPDLEGLQLGGCHELTDAAFTDLFDSMPKLTHLDLEELTEISNVTLQKLSKSEFAFYLEHLSVSYCEDVGDTGMLPVIKACQSLKNLEMDNTRVSDLVLIEAANLVRLRSRMASLLQPPEVGLRLVTFDCQNVTWTGVREVLSCNSEIKRNVATAGAMSHSSEVIQLKCFYGWQMTVDEHLKRVLRGDYGAATRLERKWVEYMMSVEEAGAIGAGSRRRRRRAREAAMLHADEEDGLFGRGGRRRARSNGCMVM
ncbi:MAG: hypothetical protein M1817_004797 [Caeruleum heppii]|nr:MAG: hypothetical protein M1817_004797 [Caeruleum heppii]